MTISTVRVFIKRGLTDEDSSVFCQREATDSDSSMPLRIKPSLSASVSLSLSHHDFLSVRLLHFLFSVCHPSVSHLFLLCPFPNKTLFSRTSPAVETKKSSDFGHSSDVPGGDDITVFSYFLSLSLFLYPSFIFAFFLPPPPLHSHSPSLLSSFLGNLICLFNISQRISSPLFQLSVTSVISIFPVSLFLPLFFFSLCNCCWFLRVSATTDTPRVHFLSSIPVISMCCKYMKLK